MDEQRRHAARDRAGAIWLAGFGLGLLARAADLPQGVRIAVAVAWGGALLVAVLQWLVLATRDGSVARDAPDYLWAAVALAGIALACAGATAVVLLLAGEPVTANRVAGWALIGTVVVLVTYWLRRAWRPPRARRRRR
jgi:hypothetical protein